MAVNLHLFVDVPTLLTPYANSPKRLGDLAHSTCINKVYHIYGPTEYFPMSSLTFFDEKVEFRSTPFRAFMYFGTFMTSLLK